VRFILEDKKESAISGLLLFSRAGDRMVFAEGNEGFVRKLKEQVALYPEESFALVVDFVPDNIVVQESYYRLVSTIEQVFDMKKVIVLPIPCLEFIVLDMLLAFGYVDNVTDKERVTKIVKEFEYELPSLSYEKNCKRILNSLKRRCQRNVSKQNDSFAGRFYRKSCDCNGCRLMCSDSIECKAERLYSSLPGIIVVDEVHKKMLTEVGVVLRSKSVKEVQQEFKEWLELFTKTRNVEYINILF